MLNILLNHCRDIKNIDAPLFAKPGDLVHLLMANKALAALLKNDEGIIRFLNKAQKLISYQQEMTLLLNNRTRYLWALTLYESLSSPSKFFSVIYFLSLFALMAVSGDELDDHKKIIMSILSPSLFFICVLGMIHFFCWAASEGFREFGASNTREVNALINRVRGKINAITIADLDKPGCEGYIRHMVFAAKANERIEDFVPRPGVARYP
ncbi:MAG TPA: hypothetical protein VFU82_03720 [Gammaproteobacteria bacterium]|nr:hypothetical protein [Gammaproteobacteria bacterium]